MPNVTEYLFEKGNGIIKVLPEVSDPTGVYKMADDGGVEVEVGEFLYSFIRVLKPKAVLETGTYTGISAMYMAQALKDNGPLPPVNSWGHLITLEFEPAHKARAEKLWTAQEVDHQVSCVLVDARKWEPQEDFDFMFLDTEPQIRFSELVRFYPRLKAGGFVFIHDLHRHMHQISNEEHGFAWPYGVIPTEMAQLVKEGKLRPFHLPTPRGLTGFYKPTKDDYQWK